MDTYQTDTLTLKLVSTFILTVCVLAILYFIATLQTGQIEPVLTDIPVNEQTNLSKKE